MRVGVIADTHIPRAALKMPGKVYEIFRDVDHIIHAGDIVEESVLSLLENIAPVTAVHGNRDPDDLKRKLPENIILDMSGFRIGVLHGHGDKGTTRDRMPGFFFGTPLDCIIFGHSHIPCNENINGVLYFNPGSPTVKKRQKYGSVGILVLTDCIDAQIHYLV